MDAHTFLLLFISLIFSFFNLSQGDELCYDDNFIDYYCEDYQYCCGDRGCCETTYDVWGLWWFWLIFVFVICLISSCIGCCVRASRRRRMAQYARINATRTSGYGTTTHVTVTTPNYPVGVAQPPPYNAGKIEYPAGTHHAPPQYSQ